MQRTFNVATLRCLRRCQQGVFSTKRPMLLAKGPCPCKSQLSSGSRLPLRNTTATSNSICQNFLARNPSIWKEARGTMNLIPAQKMSTPLLAGIRGPAPGF
ncbi:hypothetical protein CEXT_95401 [Caerostris extrusa]|uniref:Uncharacterized protein n=1 Tax=Caerostris extrusa TaxID=172846 RepID=A0AAV4UUU8_CAEEX|nr:hypothetical protein CEXT_95401 [Caerostris extrusa]